jgi:hypothetical protein
MTENNETAGVLKKQWNHLHRALQKMYFRLKLVV